MRTLALSLGLLAAASAACATLSTEASAEFEIQVLMSEANNAENVRKVKTAFSLAAAERGRQAIEISCAPASSSWCAKDFATACKNAEGGLSSVDDGSKSGAVTCSLPQHN